MVVDEKHSLRPVDVNGVNKLAGENYHILYHQVYGIATCVLRLTNTYGPRMRVKDARQTFVGVWIARLLRGEPLEVWGGRQVRDFTYVEDCVEALLLAAASPRALGRVFNLGADERINIEDLARLLIGLNGQGQFVRKAFPAERQQIDIGDYYSDDGLVRRELGWAPAVPLRQGLARTLDYYRENLPNYL